ncbi:MAG: hypothetical protein H7Y36_02885 [Armatimonadetes bacterium]|nr:hypothetical protein [Akkermansiaceae bacterium]
MDAFASLGLPVRLVVSEEEIREAFRLKAGLEHPDAGGDAGEFAKLQAAREVLLSPARRLMAWLEIQGQSVEARGEIETGLVDLFQKVAAVGAEAEAAIKTYGKAQSSLAKALAEVRLIAQREQVSELLAEVAVSIRSRSGRFAEIDAGAEFDAAQEVRNLRFLEKWQAGLKGIYGRLL